MPLMFDELQRGNNSPNTVRSYVHAILEFARYIEAWRRNTMRVVLTDLSLPN